MNTVKKYARIFFSVKPVRKPDTTFGTAFLLTLGIYLTQIGDFLTTRIGLKLGAAEGNPVMKSAVESFSTFLSIKLAAATLLSWFFWKRPTGAAFVIFLYTVIIVNNLYVIGRVI